MTDITEKLSKYVAGMSTRNPKDYTAFLTVEDAAEAIETIQTLRAVLRKIGYDPVELSHEKVQLQYLEHISIARKAIEQTSPRRSAEHKIKPDMNDDF